METLTIKADSGPSHILIGERLENLQRYIPVVKPIIITDVNVGQLYPLDSMASDVITIGTGEEIKTLDTVQRYLRSPYIIRGRSLRIYRRYWRRYRLRYYRICGFDLSAGGALWFCGHHPAGPGGCQRRWKERC